jgi:hypothetical protein
MLQWLGEHWFDELQTISLIVGLFGVAGGLIFNGLGHYANATQQKIASVRARTAAHREIWFAVLRNPELKRALDPNLPGDSAPTVEERIWVRSLILHCADDFQTRKEGLTIPETRIGDDIRQFFSKPIPRHVWHTMREYQELDFVHFVESNLS